MTKSTGLSGTKTPSQNPQVRSLSALFDPAQNLPKLAEHDIPSLHRTPEQAARVAQFDYLHQVADVLNGLSLLNALTEECNFCRDSDERPPLNDYALGQLQGLARYAAGRLLEFTAEKIEALERPNNVEVVA